MVYVAGAGKFAYHMDSTLYGDWDVAGVPPAGMFMNADRSGIYQLLTCWAMPYIPEQEGGRDCFSYRHEVMSGDASKHCRTRMRIRCI